MFIRSSSLRPCRVVTVFALLALLFLLQEGSSLALPGYWRGLLAAYESTLSGEMLFLEATYNTIAGELVAQQVLTRFAIRLAFRDWTRVFETFSVAKLGIMEATSAIRTELAEVEALEAATATAWEVEYRAERFRSLVKKLMATGNLDLKGSE